MSAAASGPFDAYVDALMRRAVYAVIPESGDCLGSIPAGAVPGMHGVSVTAADEAECGAELRVLLEEWVVFRVTRGLPVPPVDGLSVGAGEVEEYALLRAGVERLGGEVEALRLRLGLTPPPGGGSRLAAFNEWYKSYFTLISSGLAIVALLIAYFAYSVDPFQTYRESADKKQSADIIAKKSDYYRRLGDMMMDDMDYKEAARSYEEALKLSPTNLSATRGLLLSQLSQPDSPMRAGSVDTLPLKLQLIEESFTSDPRALLAKGIAYRDAGMYKEAIATFEGCVEAHPDYMLCYMELGFTYTWPGPFDIDKAVVNYQAAVDKNPNSFLARYNLGASYMLVESYDCALVELHAAGMKREHFGTAVSLGDAYLYSGNAGQAAGYYKYALNKLGEPNIAAGNFLGHYARYNFMPEDRGDRKTISTSVPVVGLEEDKILVNYLFALACAARCEAPQKEVPKEKQLTKAEKQALLKTAQQHFDTARGLDKSNKFGGFVANRIKSLSKLSPLYNKLDGDARKWFDERLKTR